MILKTGGITKNNSEDREEILLFAAYLVVFGVGVKEGVPCHCFTICSLLRKAL